MEPWSNLSSDLAATCAISGTPKVYVALLCFPSLEGLVSVFKSVLGGREGGGDEVEVEDERGIRLKYLLLFLFPILGFIR